MDKIIDCFFIGQNQVNFQDYEKRLRSMGVSSGLYRDLNINFIYYNNKALSAADTFNLFCSSQFNKKSSYPPIKLVETFNAAIAYLGSYLNRRGCTFDYINSFQDEKEELARKLKEEKILTVAILTTLYISAEPINEIIEYIRKYNNKIKIIVGGPFIATKYNTLSLSEYNYLLESINADFYVYSSQGESSLVNLIKAIKDGLPYNRIDNLFYKENNKYIFNKIEIENNNLSENIVDWTLFRSRINEFINIRTALSCPFSCAFCGFPAHAGQYQTMDVNSIKLELEQLTKIRGIKSIHFTDDTFNIPTKRFKQILKMIIDCKFKIKWSSFFRCQFADREMVELMKESGCESVLLGIESGNNLILENMNKKADVEKYLHGIALLKEYGIITLGNFIIGFPGETIDTVKDTKNFIEESGIDFYRAQLWYCEHITPIWKQKEKYNISGGCFEWSHNTMNSKTASGLIDNMILSIKNSIRYPQYYFDYDNVIQLVHKGLTLDQVKMFLNVFNNAIIEKLSNPSKREVSYEIINQFYNSCNLDVSSIEIGIKSDALRKESIDFQL